MRFATFMIAFDVCVNALGVTGFLPDRRTRRGAAVLASSSSR